MLLGTLRLRGFFLAAVIAFMAGRGLIEIVLFSDPKTEAPNEQVDARLDQLDSEVIGLRDQINLLADQVAELRNSMDNRPAKLKKSNEPPKARSDAKREIQERTNAD